MLCKNCKAELNEGEKFCSVCGTPVNQITENDIPEEYRPLSPWAYFGLQLLYSIPIVGFVFLIIFSFKKSNLNRRNFTRSYWCSLIILGAIAIIAVILFAILGISAASVIESRPTLY